MSSEDVNDQIRETPVGRRSRKRLTSGIGLRPVRIGFLMSLLSSGASLAVFHAVSSRDASVFVVTIIALAFGVAAGVFACWILLCGPVVRLEKRWHEYLRLLRSFRYQTRSDSYDVLRLDEEDLLGATSREVHRLIVDSYAHYAEAARLRRTMNDAIRVQVSRATAHLDRLAHTDALTDMPNRRAVEVAVPPLLDTCRAHSTELIALLVDVDHLHVLNDHGGRDTGDDMLIRLAASLRSVLRETDVAFRYGGDCFLVLFQNLEPHQIGAVAGRVSRHFAQVTKVWSEQRTGWRPSLSMGVASLRYSKAVTAEAFLGEAQAALQQAKSSGGGRLVCAWQNGMHLELELPIDRSSVIRTAKQDGSSKPYAA